MQNVFLENHGQGFRRKCAGRLLIFETIMAMGNHLGLFSEEVEFDTKELIGNFPQAITHLGIIRAAVKLNDKLKNNGKTSLNYQ